MPTEREIAAAQTALGPPRRRITTAKVEAALAAAERERARAAADAAREPDGAAILPRARQALMDHACASHIGNGLCEARGGRCYFDGLDRAATQTCSVMADGALAALDAAGLMIVAKPPKPAEGAS